jgi:hypothetical protein
VSNGPWTGEKGKLNYLRVHDVMLLNHDVRTHGELGWDEEKIHDRTSRLIKQIQDIWPVPSGHRGLIAGDVTTDFWHVSVGDLLREGMLTQGQVLHGRNQHADARAMVLEDGRLQLGDKIFDTPSGAAQSVKPGNTSGWQFWSVEHGDRLSDLRDRYTIALQARQSPHPSG